MAKPILTTMEYKKLVRVCSAVSQDPGKMFDAVWIMLGKVHPLDADWLKAKLGIKEET